MWHLNALICADDAPVEVLGRCHSQERQDGDSDAGGCHCDA
jgi:hypothetical protein